MPSLTFLWQFCEFYLLSSSSERGTHKINMQLVSVKSYWKITQAWEFVNFVFKAHALDNHFHMIYLMTIV